MFNNEMYDDKSEMYDDKSGNVTMKTESDIFFVQYQFRESCESVDYSYFVLVSAPLGTC